jgi:hypothetical protein
LSEQAHLLAVARGQLVPVNARNSTQPALAPAPLLSPLAPNLIEVDASLPAGPGNAASAPQDGAAQVAMLAPAN